MKISQYNNRDFRTTIVRPEHFGIDKLVLTTKDFRVTDATHLNITGLTKKAGKSELPDSEMKAIFQVGTNPIYGSKAYINTEQFNLNINPTGLQIICNPSKMVHPYHLVQDENAIEKQVLSIEKECRKIGVSFDSMNMALSRVDIAKQNDLPRMFAHYDAALVSLRMKGAPKSKAVYNYQSYSMGNKQNEVIFYDKFKELKNQNSAFCRAEYKLKTTSSVRKHLTAYCFKDLLANTLESWLSAYDSFFEKMIFRNDNQTKLTFDVTGLSNLIQTMVSNNPKGKGLINKVNSIIGAKSIYDEIGLDAYLHLFEPYLDERTIRRQRNQLIQLAHQSKIIGRPINVQVLIDELKNTFLYAA